jgi:SPP1 gp7 family putative phage head morphogenesis protein
MSFPLQLEKQFVRAVERYLNAIDKLVMREIRNNVDYRNEVPVQDGLLDIQQFLSKLAIQFETLKETKLIRKVTENTVKSLNKFAQRLIKKKTIPALSPVADYELDNIVKQNVSLIETVGKDYLGTIQERVTENIRTAGSQKELAKALELDTKVDRNKAKFWASDQLGKAYGKLAEKNQRAAGGNKFKWRTQKDGRVRDTHADLEGTVHSWDDLPIINGKRLAPGEDYNCRCWPDFLLPDEDQDDPPNVILANRIKMLEKKAEM